MLRPILGEEGLLLAEGKAWKHQRRTLAPPFSPRAVGMLVPHMIGATDDMIVELRESCDGRAIDLREAMQRLALDIAGRTMFSFALERHGPTLRHFVNFYGDHLAQPHFLDVLLPPRMAKRRAILRGANSAASGRSSSMSSSLNGGGSQPPTARRATCST